MVMVEKRRVAIAMDLTEPYPNHQEVFVGILRYAREHPAWECVIDEHPLARSPSTIQSKKAYSGVIGRFMPEAAASFAQASLPCVNTFYQQDIPGMANVNMCPQQVGEMSADHLLDRGFCRVYTYYDPSSRHTAEAARAMKKRTESRGKTFYDIPYTQINTNDLLSWSSGKAMIETWAEHIETPAALFVDSTYVARLLIQACKHRGLAVPQDVAILCKFSPHLLSEAAPQLSTIKDCYERVGYESAALLDRMIDGEPIPEHPVLLPPEGICARETTDYFAVEDELVVRALRYISENLQSKLRVDDIAEQMQVSTRTLQNRFDAALGRGVKSEVQRLRLSTAKLLLAEPDVSIESVATQAGYTSADVLGQVFRRELGMSPKAYRQQIDGEVLVER